MAGIKDIAIKCGVSPTTVSNVLNNKNNVGRKTRDMILETAKELGYVHKRADSTAKGTRILPSKVEGFACDLGVIE